MTASHSLRVFVVEDHADTLTCLRLYLQMGGHTVRTARTFHEAQTAVPLAEVDVFISDIGLPDGDGWDLLRALDFPHPIYAIAISGRGGHDALARSRAAGYRHHLVKPFEPTALTCMLQQAANELSAARLASAGSH
jgi:CheY-like chemotaxis protein